ncbi:MAG TPA: glycosyltransferase [Gemmatimonadales bacterium]|nr:glycosyltransferase [Gemmatimonadales bacterium]
MRLAVFTSRYPAQVATFFERDMRALLEAGVAIDVFSIAPLNAELWKHSLDLLGPDRLPRHRVHHLTVADSARGLSDVAAKSATARRDARAILASALPAGPVPFAKTAYVLPKAWTWAAQYRDYDHVLAYWGNYAGTCAYAYHRLATPNVPFSIWLHAGTDLYRRPVFLREKLLYADNIITCCEFNVGYLARAFADIAARISHKVFVCHHGLDLATFVYRPDGRPADRIIAVGRLSREKGYDYLVRAVQQLAARGIPAVVEFVGDGPEKADLAALARELGVADRIHFRGWLPFADVRRAMSEATVLVHPSNGLGDGLPNVLREAMAVGTPVIASDVAGIPDALRDDCGVLVPPRNVDALATAIARLLGDRAERLVIASNARRRVEAHYDLWRNGARLAVQLESTRRSPTAPPASARTTVQSNNSHDLIALRLLAGTTLDPDELDLSELRKAAERGGAIVRIADALRQRGDPFPPRLGKAAARGCQRAQQTTELVDHLSDTCTRLGVAHAFVRTAECYPDAPLSIDLLIGDPSTDVDRGITRELHATRQPGSLHHRLGGVSTYRLAAGYRLLIRHGRLGRLGEHARLARLVLARARPTSMGTAAPLAPTPEDHVLLLAMHQLYTRPEFRLSDIYTTIVALRGPVNWDYLFATALASAAIPTVACYLQYIDRIHRAVSDRPLFSDDVQQRFATTQTATDASARFPRTWSAARLYFQNLRATLESGRWHSAARLSLVPLMAALTAGHRRSA